MKLFLLFALTCLVALAHGEENESGRKKIVCLVLTTKDKKDQSNAIKNTWGKSCDRLIFSSDEEDKFLPTEKFAASYKDRYLGALEHIYQNYKNEAHWVLLADYTSYIAIDNIRKIISGYDENRALLFGVRRLSNIDINYFNSHRGMLMSAKAFENFITKCSGELKTRDIEIENLDEEVYKCLAEKEQTEVYSFCELGLEGMSAPESMDKYISSDRSIDRAYLQSCPEKFISLIAASAYEMDKLHFMAIEQKVKQILDKEIVISKDLRCNLCWDLTWLKLQEMRENRCNV